MVTSIEDLPTEIWILIFSYFEAHDLFRAFTNLNNNFHRLLLSDYLLYNVQFKKNNYSSLVSIIYCSSNTILNRIFSLQWIAKPQYGYLPQFLHKNISNFTQLRSLKIEIYPRQTVLLCKILPELSSLKNISIECDNLQPLLAKTVFILPSLYLCELISSSALSHIECTLRGQSNIEILRLTHTVIVFQSTTNSFYDYLPLLRKFEIYGSVRTFKKLSSWINNEILMSERIPITEMKCKSNRSTFIFFEHLQLIMPVVKYLSLQLYVNTQDEIVLERLIDDWWPLIQEVEKIIVSIRISKQINQADHETQTRFTSYQNIFLSKNDQLNEYSQINWTQTECPIYQLTVEISTAENKF